MKTDNLYACFINHAASVAKTHRFLKLSVGVSYQTSSGLGKVAMKRVMVNFSFENFDDQDGFTSKTPVKRPRTCCGVGAVNIRTRTGNSANVEALVALKKPHH